MGRQCDCKIKHQIEVPYAGPRHADIVVCGEAPGHEEEQAKLPFVGRSGALNRQLFSQAGLVFDACFHANAARCLLNTALLKTKEINVILKTCRPTLVDVLTKIKPKVIISMGRIATQQLLGAKKISSVQGVWQWSEEFDCWVMPTFHPAAALRDPKREPVILEDLKKVARFKRSGWIMPEAVSNVKFIETTTIDPFLLKAAQNWSEERKPTLISLDTETQGLDWAQEPPLLLCYSFSHASGKACMVRLLEECPIEDAEWSITVKRRPADGKKAVDIEVGIRRCTGFDRKVPELAKLVSAGHILKIMQNGNFDVHFIHRFLKFFLPRPFPFRSFIMDTQAAAHVLRQDLNTQARLEDLQARYGKFKDDYWRRFGLKYDKTDMLAVPSVDLLEYACADALVTREVGLALKDQLPPKQLLYFKEFVQPTIATALWQMEENGILIDLIRLPETKAELTNLLDAAHEKAVALLPAAVKAETEESGKKLVLSRNDLIKEALFFESGFRIDPQLAKQTPKGQPSIDKETRNDLINFSRISKKAKAFLTEYDKWKTYQGLLTRDISKIELAIRGDGRIHTIYSLVRAETGRSSSSSPNTQNISKRAPEAKYIRRLFVPPKGYIFLAVDSSQAELRWCAQVSQDPAMIKVFKEELDIHSNTAEVMTGKREKDMSKEEWKAARTAAKCFHPETEVLTPNGWVSFLELRSGTPIMQAWPSKGNPVRLEWTQDYQFSLQPNHHSSLVRLYNEGIDLMVTPDHRMLVVSDYSKQPRVILPADFVTLSQSTQWWNSGEYTPSIPIKTSFRAVKLAVAIQADGTLCRGKSGFCYAVRFGFSKQRKILRLQSLLGATNYTVSTHRNGHHIDTTAFYVPATNPLLQEAFRLLDFDKSFSWNLLELTRDSKEILLDELQYWDGHKAKNWNSVRFGSTCRQSAEVVLAMAASVERKAKLTTVPAKGRRSQLYHVSVGIKSSTRGGNVNSTTFPYQGDVAVLSVPSTFVLVRGGASSDRKVPVVTGQSVNFGCLYLVSPYGLARTAKKDYGIVISDKQAKDWIDLFLGRLYPGIRHYHRKTIDECTRKGYVESPFGRRRYIPSIKSDDRSKVNEAHRMAVNHPIQSASSDAVLLACNEILGKKLFTFDEARPIAFIHDELIFEVREDLAVQIFALVKQEMEHPPLEKFGINMLLPLACDGKIGYNLADMEPIEIEEAKGCPVKKKPNEHQGHGPK